MQQRKAYFNSIGEIFGLAAKWAGFGGKGSVNGGSMDVDYRDDALYPTYTPDLTASSGWSALDSTASALPSFWLANRRCFTSRYTLAASNCLRMASRTASPTNSPLSDVNYLVRWSP
jgi:hypothetical protein